MGLRPAQLEIRVLATRRRERKNRKSGGTSHAGLTRRHKLNAPFSFIWRKEGGGNNGMFFVYSKVPHGRDTPNQLVMHEKLEVFQFFR